MSSDPLEIVKIIPAIIIGLTVHEFAHAYTASMLGDNTAKDQGRVSLNPLKHIDWLGFFLIIIAGFGWAKPVLFNPENLKQKHRDEILIAIAGPISNLILALLFFIVGSAISSFQGANNSVVELFLIYGIINLGLFTFNLLPIPPLDGSHLYMTFLNDVHPKLMKNLYQYGTIGLFLIIIVENKLDINILHLTDLIRGISGFFIKLFF